MQSMLKKDFWYDLPKELIAQEPADPRDSDRLMVLSQQVTRLKIFRQIAEDPVLDAVVLLAQNHEPG